jgi:hypothetical protein
MRKSSNWIIWTGLLYLWWSHREPTGDVEVTSASMTSKGKTTEATQAEIDEANANPVSQPD